MIQRRTLLGLAALGLSACGFELRRAPELHFKTLQLAGFKAHSPLADELRRSIASSTTTRVVEAASQAEVVLVAIADSRDKGVVTSTTADCPSFETIQSSNSFAAFGCGAPLTMLIMFALLGKGSSRAQATGAPLAALMTA